jgi:hypothetical protein
MATWTPEALCRYVAELEAQVSDDHNPIRVLILEDAIADAEIVLAERPGPLL